MKKLRTISALCLMAMALTWSACSNDDTDFSGRIADRTDNSTDDNGSDEGEDQETYEIKDLKLDDSNLDEGTEVIPTAASGSTSYNDYVENSDFDYTVYVNYEGAGATLSGDVSKVSAVYDGAYVTLTSTAKGVEYVLSGNADDGNFKIYSDHKFKLTLNGLSLHSQRGAAINNQCGKSMYVVLAEGSDNRLTSTGNYAATPAGEDEKGTFFSEGQVIFSGSGSLYVSAALKNGIASDDYIRFRPGNKIRVDADNGHGVKANDGVTISGGVLNIYVRGEGAKGINSEAFVNVDGGRTCIQSVSGTSVTATETVKSAAIKCDSTYTQTAGIVNLRAEGEGGKGLNAKKTVTISGGELNITTFGDKVNASPKGITCDMDVVVKGGSVYSYSGNSKPVDATGGLTVAPGYSQYALTDDFFIVNY